MKEGSNWIPISEIHTKNVHIHMPFAEVVPQDQIGVHLLRLNRLRNLAGIRRLVVTGEYPDITPENSPTIAGFNQRGEAVAGKTAARSKVPQYGIDQYFNFNGFSQPSASIWSDVTIRLNLTEMTNFVSREDSVRSPVLWSKKLNKTLKEALQDSAKHSLLSNKPFNVNSLEFLAMTFWSIPAAFYLHMLSELAGLNSGGVLPNLPELVLGMVMSHGMANIYRFRVWKKVYEQIIRDDPVMEEDYYRASLFCGKQFDRLLLVKLLTATQSLVKPIPSKP